MGEPVNTQMKFEPRPAFVPFFSLSSSVLVSGPELTSNLYPSEASRSITGSTQAFFVLLPSLVESMNDVMRGTLALFANGSGECTVRAQSQAITVASVPSDNLAFG